MIVEVLLLAGVISLFLAHVKWEHSAFVRTIDLMPGPERRIPFLGNFMTFFGKQSDGKCDSPTLAGSL